MSKTGKLLIVVLVAAVVDEGAARRPNSRKFDEFEPHLRELVDLDLPFFDMTIEEADLDGSVEGVEAVGDGLFDTDNSDAADAGTFLRLLCLSAAAR